MNWDRVQGNWKQLKGSVRVKWARLTADHTSELVGQREMLAGGLQEAYGIGKDEAGRQIDDWHRSVREVANDHDAIPRQVSARP